MGPGGPLEVIAGAAAVVPFLCVVSCLFVLLRLPAWIDLQRERILSGLARCAAHGVPLTDGLNWLIAESWWPVSGWLERMAQRIEAGETLERATRGAWLGVPVVSIFLPDLIPAQDRRLLACVAKGVPVEVALASLAGLYRGRVSFRARMRRRVALPLYAACAAFTLALCAGFSGSQIGVGGALNDIVKDVCGTARGRVFEHGLLPIYAGASVLSVVVAVFVAPRNRTLRRIAGHLPFTRFVVRDLEWVELGRRLGPALAAGRPLEAALDDIGATQGMPSTRGAVAQWRNALLRGVPLREALAPTTAPAGWKSLVVAGAAVGDLPTALAHATDYLETLVCSRLGLCEQLGAAVIALGTGVVVGSFVHLVFSTLLSITEGL